jgi:hypothetical protein
MVAGPELLPSETNYARCLSSDENSRLRPPVIPCSTWPRVGQHNWQTRLPGCARILGSHAALFSSNPAHVLYAALLMDKYICHIHSLLSLCIYSAFFSSKPVYVLDAALLMDKYICRVHSNLSLYFFCIFSSNPVHVLYAALLMDKYIICHIHSLLSFCFSSRVF